MWMHELAQSGEYGVIVGWLFWIIASITLHELAHGWAALWQGDPTPRALGHMIASPMVHMGPMSLIALALGYGVASDNRAERSTIPLVMAMRNPGLALLLVQQMAPEASELKAAIVGYVVMTAIGMTPFLRWRKSLVDSASDISP